LSVLPTVDRRRGDTLPELHQPARGRLTPDLAPVTR
jgi:hypothetical protein